jgi:N-acetylglucosaminylphosphatidylinositol deacetylase
MTFLLTLSIIILCIIILVVILFLVSYIIISNHIQWQQCVFSNNNHGHDHNLNTLFNHSFVMLITAHPDDEVMFFLPTMKYVDVVLCLSDGNANGLGNIRKIELKQAVKALSRGKVEIISTKFQDGFKQEWNANDIALEIESTLNVIDTNNKPIILLTFDEIGISNHPNHIACHYGVEEFLYRNRKQLFSQKSTATDQDDVDSIIPNHHNKKKIEMIHAFSLKSDSILKKFTSVIGVTIHILMKNLLQRQPCKCCIFNASMIYAYQAMMLHQSQFVWFRKIFVIMARCLYLNEFMEISGEDNKNKR